MSIHTSATDAKFGAKDLHSKRIARTVEHSVDDKLDEDVDFSLKKHLRLRVKAAIDNPVYNNADGLAPLGAPFGPKFRSYVGDMSATTPRGAIGVYTGGGATPGITTPATTFVAYMQRQWRRMRMREQGSFLITCG
jgi:hypothetical protein